MMAALHAALRPHVARIFVSLEEVMACGVGVCMGCVTPSVRGMLPICTEGPVFRSEEVFDLGTVVQHA
jgi:dihydroorotate dehydrogenase electron transfer subunit